MEEGSFLFAFKGVRVQVQSQEPGHVSGVVKRVHKTATYLVKPLTISAISYLMTRELYSHVPAQGGISSHW